jgi:hypothetical protein
MTNQSVYVCDWCGRRDNTTGVIGLNVLADWRVVPPERADRHLCRWCVGQFRRIFAGGRDITDDLIKAIEEKGVGYE